MKYILILAGGTGSRMGNTEVPKQFIEIDNIPIIMYTIKQLNSVPNINKMLVVIPEHFKEYLDNLLKKNNYNNVITIIGGTTRYESILNGCSFISNNLNSDSETIILSHDAVRPFVSKQIIDDHLNLINFYSAVDTIIPIVDTIVEIDAGKVTNIPDRSRYFMSQTPQTFKLNEYLELCSSLLPDEKEKLTDVCKIYYLKKKKIGYVMGETSNFKITTPIDLELAKSLIKKKKYF